MPAGAVPRAGCSQLPGLAEWRRITTWPGGDLQEAIQKRLQMFVLRAKVKLASQNESTVLFGL